MTIYELNRNATPRPDNPGNCDRRTRALRRFMNHANAHYMEALKLLRRLEAHDGKLPAELRFAGELGWKELLSELEEVEE